MTFVQSSIASLVDEIAKILESKNSTLAISEGSSGGLISAYLVARPGASKFFHGGNLLYSIKSQLKLSGWTEEEISAYTGPSETSVSKQARNLRIQMGATYTLAESGFTGPCTEDTKSTESVGTVYFAVCGPSGMECTTLSTGKTDRAQNMELFAQMGLEFLLKQLQKIE